MPPTPPMRRVVILDRDPSALDWLAAPLAARGHHVLCHGGGAAMRDIAAAPADLLVAYRPGWSEDGRAWLNHLHETAGLACVVVLGPDEAPEDRVAFLEAGADDCLHLGLPRPEILARVVAALRRAIRGPALATARDGARPRSLPGGPVIAGGWRLLPEQRSLLPPDGRPPLRLTSAEFEFLRILSGAEGAPVDRDAISRAVFRRPWRVEDRAVDSLVKRLRQKIGDDPIASVRGVGYALLTAGAPHLGPAGPEERSAARPLSLLQL